MTKTNKPTTALQSDKQAQLLYLQALIDLMKTNGVSTLQIHNISLTLLSPEQMQVRLASPTSVPQRDKTKQIEEFSNKLTSAKLTPKEKQMMDFKDVFELATYSSNPSITAEDFIKSYLESSTPQKDKS